MEKLIVGKIVKAQGIKGEVKIKSYLDQGNLFKTFKYLYVEGIRTAVRCARYADGFAYVGFTAVVDRNQAEALRNKDVFADRDQIAPGEYSYFIGDMIGAEVFLDDGSDVGVLDGIMPNEVAADVFVIRVGEKNLLVPFLKELIVSVKPEERKIVFSAKRFSEVSVYDE